MLVRTNDEGGDERPLSLRTVVIYGVATMVAVCAGEGARFLVGRVLDGAEGAAVPVLAALVLASWAFGICVEVLRRHIR